MEHIEEVECPCDEQKTRTMTICWSTSQYAVEMVGSWILLLQQGSHGIPIAAQRCKDATTG
jgi:hypothetical protein